MAAPRAVLFVDYQNVYRGAREAFAHPGAPPPHGQVHPLALGELIAKRSRPGCDLAGVRIYRGQPNRNREPARHATVERQCRVWRSQPKAAVCTRTLRYPADWPASRPQEKGIDVALGVDFVLMAARSEYDVGIIMSTDTDLVPALEAVIALEGSPFPRCEVAAWSAPNGYSQRLGVRGRRIWCHWLDEEDYRAVADPRDYSKP